MGKLTLRIDPSVVKRAKDYAAELRQATPILRRVAQGEADVRKGGTVPQEKVFKSLRTRLAGKSITTGKAGGL